MTDDRGLTCKCGHKRLRVVYTRPARGCKIIRLRECEACGKRFPTWEKAIGAA